MKNDYDPGELRECVKIMRSANTRDSEGNIIAAPYTAIATTRANIIDKSSDVASLSGELIHAVRTEITLRYRTDILESDQIVDYISSRTFEQTAPPIMTYNKKWLVLTCREVTKPHG